MQISLYTAEPKSSPYSRTINPSMLDFETREENQESRNETCLTHSILPCVWEQSICASPETLPLCLDSIGRYSQRADQNGPRRQLHATTSQLPIRLKREFGHSEIVQVALLFRVPGGSRLVQKTNPGLTCSHFVL
jgi:hypothetical protein